MSSKPLYINKHNFKIVQNDDMNLLFHVPSSALFDLNDEELQLIQSLEFCNEEDLQYVNETSLQTLKKLNIIGQEKAKEAIKVENFPATTLILNIVTGCNLSCTYCYKEDLTSLKNGGVMDFETAKQAIHQLYEGAPNQKQYNITYFGGEPLSNMALIEQITKYAIQFFSSKKALVDFCLTTNATLLTPKIVEFFKYYKFGITISIDGPKAIHDKTRLTVNGSGSYEVVKNKSKMLLENYQDRPVGARVTLTAGVTQVEEIWDHLFNSLEFTEVGFAPATASDNAMFNLSEKELVEVFNGFKKLGDDYVQKALNNEFNGFSNLHRLMGDIHAGRKKSLPCGAGVGLLSVNYKGEFDLCHRFTGSDLKPFGSVQSGLDKPRLSNFIEKRLNSESPSCASCHIRHLCAGGCYHESYVRYNDPSHAVLHYCDIMRDWIDYGLKAYATIMHNNPDFLEKYFKNETKGDTNGFI